MSTMAVALLAGGHVSEHTVSLRTSATLRQALRESGYRVHPVVVGMDGTWNLLHLLEPTGRAPPWPVEVPGTLEGARLSGSPLHVSAALRSLDVDVVVLGLHGRGGEDGTMQGFLHTAGFAYTGSDTGASALCMDKIAFKRMLVGAGLPTPSYKVIRCFEADTDAALRAHLRTALTELGPPLVLKPPSLGSSVGVHMAGDEDAAFTAARDVLSLERRVLVERCIRGQELTCAVLGSRGDSHPLPVIEIVPRRAAWFNYASKYQPEGADEIVPAKISRPLAREIQDLAVRVHQVTLARGVTRTDFMIDGGGRPWILESNTLPGLTAESLVPKAAAAAGLSLSDLVRAWVHEAIVARSGHSDVGPEDRAVRKTEAATGSS